MSTGSLYFSDTWLPLLYLQTTQQQVEKLLRSNRSIKKAREKMAEEFENEIKQKNSLIHHLEVADSLTETHSTNPPPFG